MRLLLLQGIQSGLDLVILVVLGLDVVVDTGHFLCDTGVSEPSVRTIICPKMRSLYLL